jgi:transcriptional regulator with XRE-family HTH domain
MDLRSRVRELANERGMSLPDLERALEFGNGTIVKWDKAVPNVDKLSMVADYFDVSVDYLLGKSEYKKAISEEGGNRLELLINEYSTEAIKPLSRLCKHERINKDLTENNVSKAVNIDLDEYLQFENNFINIGIDKIIKTLSFYGLNISYVTGLITGALIEVKTGKDERINVINRLLTDEKLKEQMISLFVSKNIPEEPDKSMDKEDIDILRKFIRVLFENDLNNKI